jgi:hypothetical protein
MLLHVAQWDVCCDGDEAAAAAQSDAQAQLLFQGLGVCLGFMSEERLSVPRVRTFVLRTHRNMFTLSSLYSVFNLCTVLLQLLWSLARRHRLQRRF